MSRQQQHYCFSKSKIHITFRPFLILKQERGLFLFHGLGNRNLFWYHDFLGSWEKMYCEKWKIYHISQIMIRLFEPCWNWKSKSGPWLTHFFHSYKVNTMSVLVLYWNICGSYSRLYLCYPKVLLKVSEKTSSQIVFEWHILINTFYRSKQWSWRNFQHGFCQLTGHI